MSAGGYEVILDRAASSDGGGWTVEITPKQEDLKSLNGRWPEYQPAALYASQLARARGWPLIRRGEARQACSG